MCVYVCFTYIACERFVFTFILDLFFSFSFPTARRAVFLELVQISVVEGGFVAVERLISPGIPFVF